MPCRSNLDWNAPCIPTGVLPQRLCGLCGCASVALVLIVLLIVNVLPRAYLVSCALLFHLKPALPMFFLCGVSILACLENFVVPPL